VFEFFDDMLTYATQWYEELVDEQPEMSALATGSEIYAHDGPNVDANPRYEFEAPVSYINQLLPTLAKALLFKYAAWDDDGELSADDLKRYKAMHDPVILLIADSTQRRMFTQYEADDAFVVA
jgi:hypothetical protein